MQLSGHCVCVYVGGRVWVGWLEGAKRRKKDGAQILSRK